MLMTFFVQGLLLTCCGIRTDATLIVAVAFGYTLMIPVRLGASLLVLPLPATSLNPQQLYMWTQFD